MTNAIAPRIYLLIDVDWPKPFTPDHGKKARHLHDVVQGKTDNP